MKKITLLFALVFSSSLMFGQIYFEEDFNTSTPNMLPTGWTGFDGDGGTHNTAVTEFDGAPWIAVDRDGTASGGGNYGGPAGDIAAASSSWYTPAGSSDDWLISPAITPTTDSQVTWDAKAQDASYADGYELLISTTGATAPGDFGTVLFSIANEAADWQTRTVDLSAYTNQTIYLAWRNNSTDQFVLLVDNIIVEEIPSCFDPTDFVLGPNGITDTSADIAWTDANGAGAVFDIEWGLDGFTPGTGTVINDISATNYDFTSLMPDTAYDFYITTNCTGGLGDSDQVGPISFTTAFDCSSYGLPYTEDWSNLNAYASCYTIEDANTDMLSWLFNTANDLDGDGTNDNIVNIFPQAANVAKDDWLFTPAISGTMGAEYMVTVTYNAVDFQATANETFDLVITDTPASTAGMQSVIGSYNSITQSGLFGDTGGNDLITQAYSSTATYTAAADGDFHVAIHANTPAAGSDVFFILSIEVTETLSVNEFDSNTISHNYNKVSETLNLESSTLPMTGIEIYSILGQNVISRSLNNTSESINVSELNDGVYLAKVYINDNFKTIKFVKN